MELPIKVFISHAHKDQQLAQLLVNYLSSEYELNEREIRCTSVPDNDLPLGEIVAEQLRTDVSHKIVFIALLSHFGLDSVWVKFELGAAWVTRQEILPLVGPKMEKGDDRMGPISYMPFLMIEDDQCELKLEKYIWRMATKHQIARRIEVDNIDKLTSFIRAFRQFGGQNADFKATSVHIVFPNSGMMVDRVTTLKMDLKGVPENGFIWVGVLDTQINQVWPKESLEDSHTEGERSVEINENGDPKPGKLAFVVLGAGPAGNEFFKDWRRRTEKTGNYAGVPFSALHIHGCVELDRVDQLTLNKLS